MAGPGNHGAHAQEITGECPEPGIGDLFLLYPFRGAALLHLVVNVRHADNDEAVIVFHAGNLHADIVRFPVRQQTVRHEEGVIPVQGFQQVMAFHCLRELGPVIRMHIFIDLDLAFFKEMPPPPCLCQSILVVVRLVFDKLLRIQIHIEQVRVAPGQRLGNVRIDDAVAPGLFIGFPGSGDLPPDTHDIRHVLADAQDALAAGCIRVFQLGGLELPLISFRVRHVLDENIRCIHRERNPVLFIKLGRSLFVKDLRGSESDHAVRVLPVRVPGKVLVAGKIYPGFGVLGKVHPGHIVQKGGDGLFQLSDLLRFLQKALLFVGGPFGIQLLRKQDNDNQEHHCKADDHNDPVILEKLDKGYLQVGTHMGGQRGIHLIAVRHGHGFVHDEIKFPVRPVYREGKRHRFSCRNAEEPVLCHDLFRGRHSVITDKDTVSI